MTPLELHVYDVDGTLYRSPAPRVPDPVWWFHAHSFGTPKEPGFDHRWILSTLARARHSVLDPTTMTVVLTGRPDHPPMRQKISDLLRLTGLHFDSVVLQPIIFPGTTAQYKGLEVHKLLDRYPTINKVILYDDEEANHLAVAAIAKAHGRKYKGYRTPGVL